MKTAFALVAILALSSFVAAQDSVDTYGKTEKEIVAMGEDGWHDFYISKAGDSTASESSAYGIFGTVLEKANDQLAASQNKTKEIAALRDSLLNGGIQLTEVGSDIAEGGTIWNIIGAHMEADVEDAISGYLEHKPSSGRHYVVSEVKKQIDLLAKKIESEHKDKDLGANFNYSDAKAALAKVRRYFDKVVAFAAHCNRADSDRFIEIYVTYSKQAYSLD
jgi:hypothetical protein